MRAPRRAGAWARRYVAHRLPTAGWHRHRTDQRRVSGRWRQVPFWGVHAAAVVGVIALGWSWSGLGLAVALYYARMFFITAGFHRYFAHRTFRTSRFMQLVLALGAMTSAQQGPLWWASHHRLHHRFADQPSDPHSPVQRGFWWAHVAWIFAPQNTGTKWGARPRLRALPGAPLARSA